MSVCVWGGYFCIHFSGVNFKQKNRLLLVRICPMKKCQGYHFHWGGGILRFSPEFRGILGFSSEFMGVLQFPRSLGGPRIFPWSLNGIF